MGSPDVMCNGRPALRVDDPGIHMACCGTNMWNAKTGSATVFINNKKAHRMLDHTKHCGGIGKLIEGSPNVLVGDSETSGGGAAGGGAGGSAGAGGGGGGGAGGGAAGGGGGTAGGGGPGGGGPGGGSTTPGGGGSPGTTPGSTPPGGGAPGTTPGGETPPGENPPAPTQIDEHQIEVQIVSALGKPIAAVEFDLKLPDGETKFGSTGSDGFLRFSGLTTSGAARLVLPEHDAEKGSTQGAYTSGALQYKAGGVDVNVGQASVVEVAPRIYRGRLSGILFDTDRTFVTPGALDGMRLVKRLYDEHPDTQVLVTGHADSIGDATYNRDLSSERAESMAAFLADQVDAWLAWYRGKPHSKPWGTREDQYMLATIVDGNGVPYFAGPVTDAAGPDVSEATKRYQTDRALAVDGFAGDETRRALVTDYMAIDGTSLPPGTVVKTHGCGESHPADAIGDNVDDQDNRRVEIFLFEGPIDPPPVASCPVPSGCSEYAQWLERTVQTIDLAKTPGHVAALVTDHKGKPLEDAAVHVSGPTSGSAMTGHDGRATIADLAPGAYVAIARLDKFDDETVELTVPEGGTATITLALTPTIDWECFGLQVSKSEHPDQREPICADAPDEIPPFQPGDDPT